MGDEIYLINLWKNQKYFFFIIKNRDITFNNIIVGEKKNAWDKKKSVCVCVCASIFFSFPWNRKSGKLARFVFHFHSTSISLLFSVAAAGNHKWRTSTIQ